MKGAYRHENGETRQPLIIAATYVDAYHYAMERGMSPTGRGWSWITPTQTRRALGGRWVLHRAMVPAWALAGDPLALTIDQLLQSGSRWATPEERAVKPPEPI